MLVDTHCHLTHQRFSPDLPEVLGRAGRDGVAGIVAVASDLEDVGALLELLDRSSLNGEGLPWLRATAGVHPHEARHAPPDLRDRLLKLLGSDSRIVALGECGLDFHYDFSPRPLQHRVFDVHLEAAAESGVPVVVHCREAEEEMAVRVREAGEAGVRGVLHCFPGDFALFDSAMEADWLVSFTGLVTFKSFAGVAVVRAVPPDRYMLETDGPYMAPVPHRGKRNEPAWVTCVRDRVAELRDVDPAQVERESGETAAAFFRLTPAPA